VRLGRQGAFKYSALWCVRVGKGLRKGLPVRSTDSSPLSLKRDPG
jgi:hypothetical protein